MREIFYAILFVLFAFLPFHLLSSPKAYLVSMKNIDPSKFELKVGKEGGTLYYILLGDPKTLNPALAQETSSTAVLSDLFSGLTRLNLKTMEYEPDLAEGILAFEDGKRYVVKLRKDVKWSDGKPFTAEDVVFTYRDVYLTKTFLTLPQTCSGEFSEKKRMWRTL
jgi:ABC-type dipeptide transport system, periplasmic component